MNTRDSTVLVAETGKKYFIAADVCTHEAVAVLEAEHETEARRFFSAVCQLLLLAPKANFRLLEDKVPPSGVPVFHRQYLRALQVNAQKEARVSGAALH